MKAISQSTTHPKTPKLATLTALAAACTMLLSAPAIAATDTAATAKVSTAPSAIDSSTRVIRRAQPNATVSPAQQPTAQQPTAQQPTAQQPTAQQPTAQAATQTKNQPNVAQPVDVMPSMQPATDRPRAAEQESTTRVYQRGPITTTGIDISRGQLPSIPVPKAQISNISFVPTTLISQTQGLGTNKLDVSLLDDFIKEVSPNARHYPPNFPNRTQRHYSRENIKVMAEWIEPYASAPEASYDVLLRAAKLNGMGRNLDLGTDFAVRGGKYIDRAIKAKPDSGEANFLYGMMLSEGGGFKEGQKYLDRAVALGYTEAEQSLAQSDLLSDRRSQALDRLRRLEQQVPDNTIIREQIKRIEAGEYYIWDLPSNAINVKPMTL